MQKCIKFANSKLINTLISPGCKSSPFLRFSFAVSLPQAEIFIVGCVYYPLCIVQFKYVQYVHLRRSTATGRQVSQEHVERFYTVGGWRHHPVET
jgi:hypothetical protein